jgi:hypothetical protein
MSWRKWSVLGSTTEHARRQSPRASTGRPSVPVAALGIDVHFPKAAGVREPAVCAGGDAELDTPLPGCFRPAAVRDATVAARVTRNLRLHSLSASHPVSCPQPGCLLRSTSTDTGRNSARSIILQPEPARGVLDARCAALPLWDEAAAWGMTRRARVGAAGNPLTLTSMLPRPRATAAHRHFLIRPCPRAAGSRTRPRTLANGRGAGP